MPADAYYLLIGAGALIVIVALWKGGHVVIRKDSIEAKGATPPSAPSIVDVLGNTVITDATVGNVTGISTEGSQPPAAQSTHVLDRAHIDHAQLGNITGIDQRSQQEKKK